MNQEISGAVGSAGRIVVTLDCETNVLPSSRKTLNSIRSHLETLALANQRILGELIVDGQALDLSLPMKDQPFRRVDAVTIPLSDLPLLLLATAGKQAERARAAVEAALTLVLINNAVNARELWWNIASQLKEPILTLSLMPEPLCQAWFGTSFHKLRRWQLEQISLIVQRVDAACDAGDSIRLSDALENLVLPWLNRLHEHILLWQETTLAGARLEETSGWA